MFNKLKQFKDLREQAKEMQNALAQETTTATELGGKLSLVIDGTLALKSVTIDPELLSAANKEKLEKAIVDAHANGLKKMQRTMAMKMKEMGGLPQIPGLN